MTLEEAAEKLEWSRGRLAHMEGNKWTRPDINNVRLLLDLYKVTDEEKREAVLTLARQSRQRDWWQKYSDVFGGDTYVGLESEASVIKTFEFLPTAEAGGFRPDLTVGWRYTPRDRSWFLLHRPGNPEVSTGWHGFPTRAYIRLAVANS